MTQKNNKAWGEDAFTNTLFYFGCCVAEGVSPQLCAKV